MLKGNTHAHGIGSDGRESAEKMIKEYRKKGYDFVIMTDHRNREEVYNYPDVDGIVVINGCEVSKSEHYVYAKEGDVEIKIKCHPNRYDDPVSEVEEWNLYEATEHARFLPQYMKCRGNYPVFSDDAHSLRGVGHAGILVDADKDAVSILKNIKSGNFRLWANQFQNSISAMADFLGL